MQMGDEVCEVSRFEQLGLVVPKNGGPKENIKNRDG